MPQDHSLREEERGRGHFRTEGNSEPGSPGRQPVLPGPVPGQGPCREDEAEAPTAVRRSSLSNGGRRQ